MQLSIAAVLSPQEIVSLRSSLAGLKFIDGRQTAGWSAAEVKNNQQAFVEVAAERLLDDTLTKLRSNSVLEIAARPKSIIRAMFSRYEPGMFYGTHVDNAVMDGERADVSFTLFLSDPANYDGGELIIELHSGEEAIKLPAGSMFTYPSATLHRVAEVTRGERLALVGWIRSFIRDPARRELLFDLDTARRALYERVGKCSEFDLLSKTTANLLRMWIDD